MRHRTDTSPRVAGAVSDTVSAISVGVADNPVTASSAAVEMSDRGSGTDHLIGHVSATLADASESASDVSDTAQTMANSTRQVSDTVLSAVSDTPFRSLSMADSTQALTGQSGQTSDTCPPAFADVPGTLVSDRKRLSAAVEIVQTYGPLSGSDMAKQMSRCGHPMSERTGLRWRVRAEEHRQQRQTLVPAG